MSESHEGHDLCVVFIDYARILCKLIKDCAIIAANPEYPEVTYSGVDSGFVLRIVY